MKQILVNSAYNYHVYSLPWVIENQQDLIRQAEVGQQRFDYNFPNKSSTKMYRYYNFFSLTTGSISYYRLFSDIRNLVRNYTGSQDPLWIQSWINYHSADQVLDWHVHTDSTYHGYVSIDPKITRTVFTNYEIHNNPGQVYIGESYVPHCVLVDQPYLDRRITLGFDIFTKEDIDRMCRNYGSADINIGMIPI